MKGQSKRFVDHNGRSFKTIFKRNVDEESSEDGSVGFFDLWRYSTWLERSATVLGVLFSWVLSVGQIAAIVVYGEFTGLFVTRHTATLAPPQVFILKAFNGGAAIPAGNRSEHMDALVVDSQAFAVSSAVIIFVQFANAALAVTLANWAGSRMVTRLRSQLLRAVLRQEVGFFDTNSTMNFASTLTEDMEKLRDGVGEHVVMITYLGGSVVTGCSLAMYYGWQLTLAGLAVVPFSIVVAALVAKYQTRCSAEEVKAYSTAGRVVEEALANIKTVRAYAGEQIELERYQQALQPAAAAARRRGAAAGGGAGAGWLLTYAINAVVFGYGAALLVRHMQLPPEQQAYHSGTLLTILFCTFMSAQNIAMCHPHLEVLSTARGAAKSVFKLLERKTKIDAMADEGAKPDKFRGDIVFDNVYFNYPSRPDVKVLRGFSLKVSAGETVAFVGGSGCGKSTLLQLLQRLYEPESGSVYVDGHNVKELNLHHYRTSIGVVGQEPVLFGGTIRDNITLGAPNVTDEQMIKAAKLAHAHMFITKLAKGYDTMLGESGAQLSGGQKQRVAIARALICEPRILLLDEPTSALDPAAEAQVQSALDAASQGRTTLVVSHRLSTIVNASRIVMMEQGSVLESGTHSELLEKRGAYYDLLQKDLTTKSISKTQTEAETPHTGEDDKYEEGEISKSLPATPFKRTYNRASSRSSLRRSARLGSVAAAHVGNVAAPGLLSAVETTLEDPTAQDNDDDEVPPVSTWRLLQLNAAEWPLLAGGALASLLVGATMPIFALLFSKLYGMFSSPDPAIILYWGGVYAGLFAAVAAVCGVVTFLQTWLFNVAGSMLTDRLRVLTFENYLQQEQAWFDRRENSVGSLCARLATQCAAVQGATGSRLGTVLQGVSTMVIGVTLSMVFSWKMTLVSLLSVPCVMGGIYLEGYFNQKSEVKEKRAMEDASRIATEAVINVRTVQSLGVEQTILSRYQQSLHSALQRRGASLWLHGPVYGLCQCAPTLGYTVSLAYGGYLIARENLPYEYAILVSEALIYGAWMLAQALSFAPNFAAAKRAGARIVAALERTPAIASAPDAQYDEGWTAKGEILFSDIHFHYPSRPSVPVLRGLTLRLPAGKTVALVGPSGCGKSTLMHLLMRNYDPQSGHVELDSVDTRRLPLAVLRAQLGLVQQEPVLFERSVRDNIAYGAVSQRAPAADVARAAARANVHAFIAALPAGYETRLSGGGGGGGGGVSGGQKQRLCVARALLRDPKVLLLDEPTSALDANSEQIVQEALEAASKDRTTIIIAHRLATIRHADIICVINKGVVAEKGSHDELVKRRGIYWELLQQQGSHM